MTKKQFLTVEQALFHAVSDHPGGATAIAAIYGWNAQTLSNSLNLNNKTHKPNLAHFKGILDATRDSRILDSVGHIAGGVFVPVEPFGDLPTDDQLLNDVLSMIQNVSEYGGVVRDSVADGRVDKKEWMRLQGVALACLRSIHVLLSRCESMREE